MKLFQYAIFFLPNEEAAKTGAKAKVLVDVTSVLAADEKGALIIASRAIPDGYIDQLDQVQIVCRPF